MTMYNYRIDSQVSALRGEVVFIGAAIVTALVVNAYILLQMANDLHCLKEMEKKKMKSKIPMGDDEFFDAAEQVQEEKPVKEQPQAKETKTDSETKPENEKQ
jgi:cell division protein FtsL